MTEKKRIRCAIYTRKSTEEGLDQDFNSLDAQFEACSAYVASQRHEGWKLLNNCYNDGGISGGTLERPALQRLLEGIDAGRVNMVVVYKIDRLTRSLADFSKLVERFDATGCSFVSVTQAFNTSSSMGRLTLNVLLSFAQFEREVTADRIRDKIAASKKKGMWMGGMVPLGYSKNPDPKLRGLVVNESEADTVQTIFRLYAKHGCLRAVQEELAQTGIRSKRHVFANKRTRGGSVMSRGQIHFLLTNPIYIGLIRHKDKTWPGLHVAIIGSDLWEQVQAKLQAASSRTRSRDGRNTAASRQVSLLVGKLVDETGDRLTPSHTTRRGRRHRYYVSNRLIKGCAGNDRSGWRLPADALETTITELVTKHLLSHADRHTLLAEPDAAQMVQIAERVRTLADRIREPGDGTLSELIATGVIAPSEITIALDRATLARALDVPAEALAESILSITSPFQTRRRGIEIRLVAGEIKANPDAVLVRTLIKAHRWVEEIRDGSSITDIAQRDGHADAFVRIRAQLAFLSPRIQNAILDGTQPPELYLERLVRNPIPLDWPEQEKRFGFTA